MQAIKYKGGMTIVNRTEKPDYQCKNCYKVWWRDDFEQSLFIVCQNCHGQLRDITNDDPIEI